MKETCALLRLFMCSLVVVCAQDSFAATYYARANGAWNVASTWSIIGYSGAAAATTPGSAPGDIVLIGGRQITVTTTPANALVSITLNHLGAAGTTRLDINTAGVVLTCNAFTMLDNNLDQHMELEVSSSARLQVNGNFAVTRGTSNARDKRMLVYVRNTARVNVTGTFTYTYNRSGGENEQEIRLDDSAQLNVTGAFSIAMGNSSQGNDQFNFQMNGSSLVSAGSTTTMTVNSADGDDMNLDLNGGTFSSTGLMTLRVANGSNNACVFDTEIDGATINANAGLTLDQAGGTGAFDFMLNANSTAAAAVLNVTGNLTVNHTSGGDQTIQTNTNSTVTVTGNMPMTFTESATRTQVLDMNGGTFTVTGNLTNTISSGVNHRFDILLDGAARFNVNNDVTIGQGGSAMRLFLNATNGSTAEFNVGRDFTINHANAATHVDVEQYGSSRLTTGRDMILNNPAQNGDRMILRMYGSSTLVVTRDLTMSLTGGNPNSDDRIGIEQNSGTVNVGGNVSYNRTAGDDIFWNMGNGTASIGGNFTFTSGTGDDTYLVLNGSSSMTIIGNLMFDLNSGDLGYLYLNEGSGSGASLAVGGSLTIDHETQAGDATIELDNGSSLSVGTTLTWDMDATNNAKARFLISNDANTVQVGTNMVLQQLSGGSNNDFDFDQQGGTVTVGGSGTFRLASGTSGDFNMRLRNTSTLNINGSAAFQFSGGDDYNWRVEDNSTVVIGGNATYQQTGGDDFTGSVNNNSSMTVGGHMTFQHTGGDDFLFTTNNNNALLVVNGSLIMQDTQGGSTITELQLDNASTTRVLGDIQMTATASGEVLIDMNNSAYLRIAGSFLRSATPSRFGTLTMTNAATLEYNGTLNTQVMAANAGSGTDGFTFTRVVVNNTYGTSPQLTTEGVTTINESLTLTRGIVSTLAARMVVMAHNSTATGGNVNSYIDGPMKKIGNDAFVFPLGNGGRWARLGMENLNSFGNTTEMVAEFVKQPSPNNGPTYYGTGIHHVSYIEYWKLDRVLDAGNDASTQVRLYWELASASGITLNSDLRVAQFRTSTTKWENHGGSATGGTSGSVLSTTAVSSFGNLSFGSSGGTNPLPVEQLSFNAWAANAVVDIAWSTASESNSDHFEVEVTRDGTIFRSVGRVAAAGYSQANLNYTLRDELPFEGTSYYRLKQVDLDGSVTFSDMVAVQFDPYDARGALIPYPNPSSGMLNVKPFAQEGVFSVEVMDATGRLALRAQRAMNGIEAMPLDASTLPDGRYIVVVTRMNGERSAAPWVKVGSSE
ncbi:MAG: hypothetical protein JNM62_11835 [Flavobacteriales bacterium]|nr:hypothetical protein [Flavobacteriales bacterium]